MKRGFIFTVLIPVILVAEVIFSVHMLSSSAQIPDESERTMRTISLASFDNSANNVASSILSDIYEIPKAYVLPLADEPMPEPNINGYSVVTNSDIKTWDNTDVLRYEDETTCVTLWKEYVQIKGTHAVFSYADIKIAHPTQIKHHLAGWEYCDNQKKATTLSSEVNAVAAISGDYYNFRRSGIIVQNKQLYRNLPSDSMPDTLFVDSNGDFLVEACNSSFNTEAFLAEHDIMFSLSFGPVLVKNGVPITSEDLSGYKGEGGVHSNNPRAAIGQIGPLHYLFCTVDGRSDISNGCTVVELAGVLAEKGCISAYNLDGGGSATLVFNDKVFNTTPSGNQRQIADIIYIATAVSDSE